MTQSTLKRKLEECADALEQYLQTSGRATRLAAEDSSMRDAVQRLSEGLYVLLPPRGPTTTLDCPRCGKPVKVSLSK